MSNPTEDRILFRPDLCAALQCSSETLRRWINGGKIPQPDIALSRKVLGWRLSSLVAAGIGIV
jgi:predicted DNA-binding transcriptional regulator AlpA